ncbi:MAG: hypothetical protein N3D09_01920 [Archaeoglobaceae archaeon]|nr:hypothetical protein [Archaeoglobaceae archaeon]
MGLAKIRCILIVSLILFSICSATAVIPSPSIEIHPVNGTVGSSISIKGRGFSIDSEIRIYFENEVIMTSKTDSRGSFSISIKVPQLPGGYYKIMVIDEMKYNAYAIFKIVPSITVSPAKGTPGTNVKISGYGFLANSGVEIRFIDPFNETEILSRERVLSNDSGVIQVSFEIPQVSAGEYRIFAVDSKAGLRTDYHKFTVDAPKITPTPKTTPLQNDKNETSQKNQTNQTTKPITTPRTPPRTPVTTPTSTPGFELMIALSAIAIALLISKRYR